VQIGPPAYTTDWVGPAIGAATRFRRGGHDLHHRVEAALLDDSALKSLEQNVSPWIAITTSALECNLRPVS
jgi:hypothetical protein